MSMYNRKTHRILYSRQNIQSQIDYLNRYRKDIIYFNNLELRLYKEESLLNWILVCLSDFYTKTIVAFCATDPARRIDKTLNDTTTLKHYPPSLPSLNLLTHHTTYLLFDWTKTNNETQQDELFCWYYVFRNFPNRTICFPSVTNWQKVFVRIIHCCSAKLTFFQLVNEKE